MLNDSHALSCETVPSPLRVNGYAGTDEIVLWFRGEADASAAPLLAHALSQASSYPHTRVSVDMAELEFIDTCCLEILFRARDQLRERGADLVVRSPRPPVRRLLEILRKQDLIEKG